MKTWLLTMDKSGENIRLQPYNVALFDSERKLGFTYLAHTDDFVMASCIASGLTAIQFGHLKQTPESIADFHKHVKLVNIEDYK